MRLTFLITDLLRGGSPLLLADLAPGLAKLGFEPDVVSIAPPAEISALLQSRGIPTSSLHARHNRDTTILPRFIEHLKRRRPHIVCSILIHANLLSTLAQPFIHYPSPPPPSPTPTPTPNPNPNPLITHYSSLITPFFVHSLHTLQQKPRWHWTLQKFLAPRADAFLAPSQAIIDKLQYLTGNRVPRPTVIPNGIDVQRFHHAAPIADPPWPRQSAGKRTVVVGYIGRFDPVKRIDLLIRALEYLPANFHLALVGWATDHQRAAILHQLPSHFASLSLPNTPLDTPRSPLQYTANPAVSHPNFPPDTPVSPPVYPPDTTPADPLSRLHVIPPTAVPERWYKSFDVFCSLSAEEGFGLTLAEAAASGLPVVACATPVSRQTLATATFIAPNPTPQQVAAAILSARDAHKPLSIEDLERRYSLATMIHSYADFFRSLLDSPPHSNR